MRRFFPLRFGFVAGLLALPVVCFAQQHGSAVSAPMVARPMPLLAGPGAVHPAMHPGLAAAGHPVLHSAVPGARPVAGRSGIAAGHAVSTRAAGIHRAPTRTAGGVARRGVPSAAVAGAGGYATPGLGFDYSHFAAVHPNDRHRRSLGGAVFPFIGGGIYIPTGGYLDGGAPQEVLEEAPPEEAPEPGTETAEVTPLEQSPTTSSSRFRVAASPALPPSSEYIFVRRDGTVFFAVAYSWLGENLQYVTQDGFRKLVARSSLDLDATTQFNEQRGLSFRSPA